MEFTEKLNEEWLISQITSYGKGKTLKSVRPKDPVAGYVWRMMRFHSGIDMHSPVICFFYLFDQLAIEGVVKKRFFAIFDPDQKEILNKLDKLVIACSNKLGISNTTAARKLKGILI